MDPKVLEKARSWASNPLFDEAFRSEINSLLQEENYAEITDRFYQDLEFGTGGLRGVLGAGSNRMNIYTVRKATQGMADYILEALEGKPASVAIAYDCRNFSDVFSEEVASVLAANGITAHLFPALRPTPMLSYAVRELQTTAGIVVTASHNPREYNGYKVYWSDGCQITAPHDTGIIGKVNGISNFSQIKTMDFAAAKKQGLIQMISEAVDESYYDRVTGIALGNPEWNKDLGIVFSPLHGAGNLPVREVLKRRGFEQVRVVEAQELPDGNFPTVDSPNPEEMSALQLSLECAKETDQLILATDPDADRIGGMVRHQGAWVRLNGNQIGQLLLAYYLEKLKQQDRLPQDGIFITTIVTSELGKKISQHYGVKTEETLTGFKYIAGRIRELEAEGGGTFLFGTEESHGYLFDDFVRDKDAVSAAMILAELCAELKQQGKSVMDFLEEIYQQFGYHQDSLVTKVIKGQAGAQQIQKIMKSLRANPPRIIAGVAVEEIRDYQKDSIFSCKTGEIVGKIGLPISNVLAFYMADGSRITARPSGTEPKIKFYFNLCGNNVESLKKVQGQYEQEFSQIVEKI
ncbi:MAG: phosphoglucomutase [SAR324 cluster bacterium]|uniref:Phosphoglucomutase n=1 Tax=SAR324 cluster bacterium TaxID=2024889 RepID=A0A2A4SN91_9DELT|nr:MAG: phosphoglucomutase [SAR324 cluster bacterium]